MPVNYRNVTGKISPHQIPAITALMVGKNEIQMHMEFYCDQLLAAEIISRRGGVVIREVRYYIIIDNAIKVVRYGTLACLDRAQLITSIEAAISHWVSTGQFICFESTDIFNALATIRTAERNRSWKGSKWILVDDAVPEDTGTPYQVIAVHRNKRLGGMYRGKLTRLFVQDWVIRAYPKTYIAWMAAPPHFDAPNADILETLTASHIVGEKP